MFGQRRSVDPERPGSRCAITYGRALEVWMRGLILFTGVLVAITGCGGDDSPPTCKESLTHYYDSGCVYFERTTNARIPLDDIIRRCQNELSRAALDCRDEWDDFLVCNNEVPSNSTTNAQCDCSPEQDAYQICQPGGSASGDLVSQSRADPLSIIAAPAGT
jgi:hypothetical protein